MQNNVKPVVKVYLLPITWSELAYRDCFDKILAAAKGLPGLQVETSNDLIVLFPKDLMQMGLGTEVLVEVDIPTNYRVGPGKDEAQVAKAFGEVLHELLPGAHVQCKVYRFDIGGLWTSGNTAPEPATDTPQPQLASDVAEARP